MWIGKQKDDGQLEHQIVFVGIQVYCLLPVVLLIEMSTFDLKMCVCAFASHSAP